MIELLKTTGFMPIQFNEGTMKSQNLCKKFVLNLKRASCILLNYRGNVCMYIKSLLSCLAKSIQPKRFPVTTPGY